MGDSLPNDLIGKKMVDSDNYIKSSQDYDNKQRNKMIKTF